MITILAQKYWKQLAGIALILIIFLFGWYKGYSYEHEKFSAFVLQTEVNAKLQEQKVEELQKSQKKVTDNVSKGYSNAIKKFSTTTVSKRVYNNTTSSSEVSNIPNSTSTVDGETKSNLSSTIRDCSLDVIQLLYLQQWIKEQEIINEW
jgi:hypothetical protein